jgi:DNA polymerase-3 subunit chi
MTEILFYHLQRHPLERVLPALIEKSLERGWRVVVQAASESGSRRSTRICGPSATTASCRTEPGARSRPAEQPVLLTVDDTIRTARRCGFSSMARRCRRMPAVISASCSSSTATIPTRSPRRAQRWSEGRAQGFEVTYWQADEHGRWQRKG